MYLLIFIITSCTNGKFIQKQENISAKKNDSLLLKERSILKKYAFCKCLIQKYPMDSTLKSDGSLAGYIEMGSYGNKAYEIVDSFISKKTLAKYNSKYKRDLYLMQCIDLFTNKELDSLINKLDNKLNLDNGSKILF